MKLYSFILLTIFSLHLFAQNNCLHLELSNINILYANVENPLKINGILNLKGCQMSNNSIPFKFKVENNNEIIIISPAF